jgi:hypothetical protein
MPESTLRRRLFAALIIVVVSALPAALAVPDARAADASTPSGSPGPTITGTVGGQLKRDGLITFGISANEPGGWRNLDEVHITMLLHALPLGQITFLPALGAIAIRGGSLVRVGTETSMESSFFRFSGLDVTVIESGNRLGLTIRARVVQDIPAGTQFQLTATDLSGATASVTRTANVREAKSGFSWGTLATVMVAALFAGSLVGGLFGSRWRRAPPPSVYAAIQRHMEEERVQA